MEAGEMPVLAQNTVFQHFLHLSAEEVVNIAGGEGLGLLGGGGGEAIAGHHGTHHTS